jgi:Ca2+-binding RTX toxin-like protein
MPLIESPEFIVNTTISGAQAKPSTAILSDGGFIITWSSGLQDGSGSGIYGQRYNADGTANGAEFQINTYTSGNQTNSSVTSLSDGGFIVTWDSDGQDGDDAGIYGQRYNADGTTNGTEFHVSTSTADNQEFPSISSLSDGGFVVTWQDHIDGSVSNGIFGQLYNADGTTNGSEFQIGAVNGREPSVTSLTGGGFVVVHRSYVSGNGNEILAQRYNADGTTNGPEFVVNTFSTYDQYEASVTSLTDGGFVVTWTSNNSQDGDSGGVFGQRYNADGTPNGAEFQVNTYTTESQDSSSVTSLPDGGFIVTWESHNQDGNNDGVFGQRYNADGTPNGTEFQINTYTDGSQLNPSVASLPDGSIVVAWEGYGGVDSTPLDSYGIFAKIFTPNEAPIAQDDSFAGDEDTDITGNLLADNGNGVDSDPDGDTITAVPATLTTATGATVTILASGDFTYTPAIGFNGSDSFDYTITDGDLTDTATVSVNVINYGTPGNDFFTADAAVDIIDGLDGSDSVDYSASPNAINIDLLNGTFSGGYAQGDTLISIENITGTNDTSTGDVINGNDSANLISALLGDDTIRGRLGNDLLFGNGGNDEIYGDEGIDVISGGDGNDDIFGGADTDYIYGGDGNDDIFGEDGNDEIYGGLGRDSIEGGLGNDLIVGGVDDDFLFGDEGNDEIYGDNGTDFIDGGDGADLLAGGENLDEIFGGDGNDHLYGNGDIDFLYGDAGDDVLSGGTDNDELYGGLGEDILIGDVGGDWFEGGQGDDRLYGGDGMDEMYGNEDNDLIYGNADDDVIFGGDGDDICSGGTGSDELYGEAGVDRIYGDDGVDFIYGGTENDILYGGSQDDIMYGDEGDDTINGGDDNDELNGGAGNDLMSGNTGNDVLFGNEGDDRLYGGEGDDILDGGAGNDTLYGNGGVQNIFFIGDGADTVLSTSVQDHISFTTIDENIDKIYGFNTGVGGDVLNITDILVGYDSATDDINDFIELYFNGAKTEIRINADGDAGGAFTRIADINSNVTETVDDLLANGNLVADSSII